MSAILTRVVAILPLILAFILQYLWNLWFDIKDTAVALKDMRWDGVEQAAWADARQARRAALLRKVPFIKVD